MEHRFNNTRLEILISEVEQITSKKNQMKRVSGLIFAFFYTYQKALQGVKLICFLNRKCSFHKQAFTTKISLK